MARKLEVEIVGDARSLQSALGKASSSASGFGAKVSGAFKMVGKAALLAGAAVGTGLAAAFKVGIDEFLEAEKVAAQTNAVLKSTGGIANVTAKQVSDLASAISMKSGIDDEAIASGANLLLTFTNIRNEVGKGNDIFNQATQIVTDMSVALGQDMKSSAIQVGKALNDPIKGVTALQRVGVSFNDVQKETIKRLVESGDKMGAQKLILAELTKEFGGSAEAAGNTFSGALNKLKNSFEEAAAGAVGALVPGIQKVVEGITGFINKFAEAEGASAKFKVVKDAIADLAGKAADAISNFVQSVDWAKVVSEIRDGIYAAIEKLGGFILDALDRINWREVGKTVGDNLVKALNTLTEFLRNVKWSELGSRIVREIGNVLKGIDWIAVVKGAFNLWVAAWKAVFGLVKGIASESGKLIFEGLKDGLRAAWPIVSEFVMSIPGRIGRWFENAGSWLYGAGLAILEGLWSGLKAKWEEVSGWFGSLGGKIKDLKGPEEDDRKLLVAEGQAIIQGFQDGMQSRWPQVAAFLTGLGGQSVTSLLDGVRAKDNELATTFADRVEKALENARAKVEGFQDRFAAAFDTLGERAKRAFDAKTAALLDDIDRKFQAKIDKWEAFSDALTPAEKALQKIQDQEAQRQRQSALEAARTQLAEAQALEAGVEKEKAVAAAREAIRQAELAMTVANLEAKAEKQRAAREAEAAEHIAGLEAAREREKQNMEERRKLLGEAFAKQFEQLKTWLSKHPGEYAAAQRKVMETLKKFGVDYRDMGELLGDAFTKGIKAAQAGAVAAAKALAKAVADAVNVVIRVTGQAAGATVKAEARQHGGPVKAGRPYLVGEKGPELFVPRMSGAIAPNAHRSVAAAGGNLTVVLDGPFYGDERGMRELTHRIRRELQRTEARNA